MLSIAKDMAEDSNESGTGGSACVGYPAKVWPTVISPFCQDGSNRHEECTVPGCTCACHKPRQGSK